MYLLNVKKNLIKKEYKMPHFPLLENNLLFFLCAGGAGIWAAWTQKLPLPVVAFFSPCKKKR